MGMEDVIHVCSSAAEVVLLVDESRTTPEAATSITYSQRSATPHTGEFLKFAEGCLTGSLTAGSLVLELSLDNSAGSIRRDVSFPV
jgi:hypothetical protein